MPLLDTAAVHTGREDEARLEFRWFPLADLDRVRLLPTCIRDALQQPLDVPCHLVHIDAPMAIRHHPGG